MILTPSQLNQRSELYHQLGSLIAAGISVPSALEMLERNPPARSFRKPLAQFRAYLAGGLNITGAVRQMGNWVPAFDLALLQAGEESGRLDACFKLLAAYYRERAQMVRNMISDLLYPAFMFHFAIVIFPFIHFFQGGTLFSFLLSTLGIFIPIYVAVFLLIYACQGRRGEAWRGRIEKILHPVPLLGAARRQLALARLATSLEALINAGVPIVGGWNLAAAASGSPALVRTVLSWKQPLQNGQTPAELISGSREFPELFANLYCTGEVSGKLDDTLRRLHTLYQEEGSRTMHHLAQWTPRLVYFAVVVFVGFKVISFYMGYFDQLNQVMQ